MLHPIHNLIYAQVPNKNTGKLNHILKKNKISLSFLIFRIKKFSSMNSLFNLKRIFEKLMWSDDIYHISLISIPPCIVSLCKKKNSVHKKRKLFKFALLKSLVYLVSPDFFSFEKFWVIFKSLALQSSLKKSPIDSNLIISSLLVSSAWYHQRTAYLVDTSKTSKC